MSGVIVVDAESFRSTCLGRDAYIHDHYLDGFFSIFESQYKVLLDLLGDLFDVTLFAVCLLRPMNCGFIIKFIYEQYLNLL